MTTETKVYVSTLPPGLLAAIRERRLAVFVGAGISMAAPSFLPDWRAFNVAVLEGAKQASMQVLAGSPEASSAVAKLSMENVAVEAFSEQVVEAFGSAWYFPLLQVLDSAQTNQHHRAIAELTRSGIIQDLFTTNFDTLIERAFRENGTALSVVSGVEDEKELWSEMPDLTLFKIHGSVTRVSTFVDTVGQKMRGLPEYVRSHLRLVFARSHLLVIGYSGADLAFGEDYLAFSAMSADGPGLTWVARPGANLRPQVARLIDSGGDRSAILYSDLQDLFHSLGATVADNMPRVEGSADSEEATRRAQAKIAAFYQDPSIGGFSCTVFCHRLLQRLGRNRDAAVVLAAMQALVANWERELPATIFQAFNLFSTEAMRYGQWSDAEHWCLEIFKLRQVWEQRMSHESLPDPSAAVRMLNSVEISAWGNLGRSYIEQGRFDDARIALQNVRALLESGVDGDYCLLLINEALLTWRTGGCHDTVRSKLRTARSMAARQGDIKVLLESSLEETHLLMVLGEYDMAYEMLTISRQYQALSLRRLPGMQLSLFEAELSFRRGAGHEGLALLRQLLIDFSDDPVTRVQIIFQIIRLAMYFRKEAHHARLELKDMTTVALSLMDRGELTSDGSIPGVPPREVWISAADELVSLTESESWISLDGPSTRESELRNAAIACEYRRESAKLPNIFAALASVKLDEGELQVSLDAMEAWRRAAERAGETDDVACAEKAIAELRKSVAQADLPSVTDLLELTAGGSEHRMAKHEELSERGRSAKTGSEKQNAAFAMARAGAFEDARELLLEAAQLYQDEGKEREACGCLQNLGGLVLENRDLHEAARLGELTLAWWERLSEVGHQIEVAASLMTIYLNLGNYDQAEEKAQLVLSLAETRPHTKLAPVALIVLLDLCMKRSRNAEMIEVAHRLVTTFTEAEVPEAYVTLYRLAQRYVQDLKQPAQGTAPTRQPNDFDEELREARRLARIGRLSESLQILDRAANQFDGDEQIARIHSAKGYANRESHKLEAAAVEYAIAEQIFERLGDSVNRRDMVNMRASVLSESGDLDTAERLFSALLQEEVPPPDNGRWLIQVNYANLLMRRFDSGKGSDQDLIRAREAFAQARQIKGLHAEQRGLIEMNDSTVELVGGNEYSCPSRGWHCGQRNGHTSFHGRKKSEKRHCKCHIKNNRAASIRGTTHHGTCFSSKADFRLEHVKQQENDRRHAVGRH